MAEKIGSAEIRTAKWEFTALSVGILTSAVVAWVDYDSSEGSILMYVCYAALAVFCITAMFADTLKRVLYVDLLQVVSAVAVAWGILLIDIVFASLVPGHGPRWLVVVALGAAAYATALRISRGVSQERLTSE